MKRTLTRSALWLTMVFFSAGAQAEEIRIGPWPDRPYTVGVRYEPGVTCTLQPEEVLDRALGYSLHCTTFDKTGLGWNSGDGRAVWSIASPAGDPCWNNAPSGSWIILDDATGRELGRGVRPCGERPKRPDGPPTYEVNVDPGVGCRMLPDEVAEKFMWQGIVSMRCTTRDTLVKVTGPEGPDRRVIWLVDRGDQSSVVDDATGMVIAHGGSGGVRRGIGER